jgi:hypothetical protein
MVPVLHIWVHKHVFHIPYLSDVLFSSEGWNFCCLLSITCVRNDIFGK